MYLSSDCLVEGADETMLGIDPFLIESARFLSELSLRVTLQYNGNRCELIRSDANGQSIKHPIRDWNLNHTVG